MRPEADPMLQTLCLMLFSYTCCGCSIMRPTEILGLNEGNEEEVIVPSHSVHDSCQNRQSNMQCVET